MALSPNTLVDAPREISIRSISSGANRDHWTQPPNGSFTGKPSQRTSVRLAPVDPIPRSETPWVVGWATTLEDRRKRLKPGTSRSRSSRFTPGVARTSELSRAVIDAGASAVIRPITVIELLTGSGGVPAWRRSGEQIRAHNASVAPAGDGIPLRRGAENDLEAILLMRTCGRFGRPGRDHGQILQDSIDVAGCRYRQPEVLRTEAHTRLA